MDRQTERRVGDKILFRRSNNEQWVGTILECHGQIYRVAFQEINGEQKGKKKFSHNSKNPFLGTKN